MYRKAGNEMQYDEVKELIAIFEKTDLNDMEVQLDNARIRLNRGAVSPWMIPPAMPQPVVPQPQVAVPVSQNVKTEDAAAMAGVQIENEPEAEENAKVIKAPIVGTFYQSSAPDEEPFVKVGDTISEGDVVCIIEAMKFMNEVNSELSGTIAEVLVKDGQFVEFGQELFRLK
ncbi:MAG: acetyl-CoA carboxylase biotin carboxyl carrier protein [Lachnospiraceae bacterium]|nr:acetyl-CoA carboxylase biotin carboxyl carrier protein [Lachnospiraceae bacterium]